MKPNIVVSLAFMIIFHCFGTYASAATILVIESYHKEYPWDMSYMEGLQAALGNNHTIKRFEMDTKRLPKNRYQEKADQAMEAFMAIKPDLVVLGDDNALSYLGAKIDKTGTPIVFLGINSHPRDIGIDKLRNATGVLERPLFHRSISELRRIMREKLSKVLILFDSGNTSSTAVKEAFGGKMNASIEGVGVDILQVVTEAEWKKAISESKDAGYDAIIVGLYQTLVDADGNNVDAASILNWTSINSPTPSFAFWDFSVGKNKAIGGLVLFGRTQGEDAAKLISTILNGTPPRNIVPVIGEKGRYLFSKSELARWKLTLPPDIEKKAEWLE
ncbi:ABC transporter substrate-binding protein [Hahella sp. HN01]|uniref:ABC transporter substrate-binding protein n=1 Tax=Hahella sp. HN01 TaxID=2847262 RepID=UPI001C1EF1AE|nr:ABC transporter substrate binding protein [Hahella sp. HN01]MBU6956001.1 hypothetical protein [Hahella sp. HN01]